MDREPTDEQLRAAWHAVAQPDWGGFDQAKAAWLHFSIARSRARLLASGRRIEPAAVPAAPPPSWGSLRIPHTEPVVDRKRAAAGERDDD